MKHKLDQVIQYKYKPVAVAAEACCSIARLCSQVIYKTRHVKVQHIYDCKAGFNNWRLCQSIWVSGQFRLKFAVECKLVNFSTTHVASPNLMNWQVVPPIVPRCFSAMQCWWFRCFVVQHGLCLAAVFAFLV